MDVTELSFPVLALDQHSSVEVFRDESELTTTWSFRLQYFATLHLLDSLGRSFKVVSVKNLGGVGPLWGFRLPDLMRRVRVSIQVEPSGRRVSFEEAKARVFKYFRKNQATMESRDDFGTVTRRVTAANSLLELLQVLVDAKV